MSQVAPVLDMPVIECRGTPRHIGQQAGEALRRHIQRHLDVRAEDRRPMDARLAVMLEAARRRVPHVMEELDGMAEGANVDPLDLYNQNFPRYPNDFDLQADGCTNVVFSRTPDGPVWGKNNDGEHADQRRPACVKLVYPDHGLPVVMITHCAMVAVMDGMNAEGVAVGHSSVGSVFQQSDRYVGIRLLAYDAMMKCRTTGEFVAHMRAEPTRGKGFSAVCVDRKGVTVAIEAACPLFEVRQPVSPRGVACTNWYQLPALREADRRNAEGKCDAQARTKFLDSVLESNQTLDANAMKALLATHDKPGLCRHGEACCHWTEYAVIGLPAQGKVLYAHGNPCQNQFREVTL